MAACSRARRWPAAPLPSLEGGDLGQGPYASMHMLLQKTVLNINVATIDVRFDKGTQGRFAELARGKAYSTDLGHQLALAAIEAKHAVVRCSSSATSRSTAGSAS